MTVPQLRSLGIQQAQGEIVALLEDDCLVTGAWCQRIIQAHQAPHAVIGGAVEPSQYQRGRDWAIYFCDYVRFMQPFMGEVRALCGNHVSYKRAILAPLLAKSDGFYEVFVHQELQTQGEILWAEPGLVVHNINSWSLDHVWRVPFHHGRGYAGMRVAGRSLAARLPFLGIALLLPLLQTVRIAQVVLTRRRYRLRFLQALPWVLSFCSSWALGECIGYLKGPGRSLEYWR